MWAVLVVSVAVTSFLSIVLTPPSIIITTVLHYTELNITILALATGTELFLMTNEIYSEVLLNVKAGYKRGVAWA